MEASDVKKAVLGTRKKWLTPVRALILFCLLLVFVGFFSHHKNRFFLPVDDMGGLAYPRFPYSSTAETAKDLWTLGTLERPVYRPLYDYFMEQSRIHTDLAFGQDVFTETKNGHLMPKHPLIISVMGAPFYGLFGQLGFWIFQQLVLVALMISFYRLAKELGGEDGALLACGLVVAGTNLIWFYSYDFSYDLLATMFIISGLSYLKKFPLLAGALFGLSLYVRVSNALVLPFLVLAYWPPFSGGGWKFLKPWAIALGGCMLVFLPYMAINHVIYGDGLRANYALPPYFVQGKALYDSGAMDFGWKYYGEIVPRLWGERTSVFYAFPGLLLVLVALPWTLRSRERWVVFWLSMAGLSTILIFLAHSVWLLAGGDRYLQPAACLLLIPSALVFRWMLDWGNKKIQVKADHVTDAADF